MAKNEIELTVSPTYVKGWGLFEAMRELAQNALDAQELDYPMEISRAQNGTVKFSNSGVILDRSMLLLGNSSKQEDDRQRGKFGEGFKLSWLVLARMNYKIVCKSGNEAWEPYIGKSDNFNSDVLKVKFRPIASYINGIEISVYGISETDWSRITDKFLFLHKIPKKHHCKVDGDIILTGDRYKNKIFNRGLYVSDSADNFKWGYDLRSLSLDRDRKMADPWSLRNAVTYCLKTALCNNLISPDDMNMLLFSDCGESAAIQQVYASSYQGKDRLTESIAAIFRNKYGDKAIPVASIAESKEAGNYGMIGIPVSSAARVVLEKELGSFENNKAARNTSPKHIYAWHDLSSKEQTNFDWVVDTIKLGYSAFDSNSLNVVDFYNDKILGLFNQGKINISKQLLSDRVELIATIVHEIAHYFGDDGDASHRHASESIFSKIIVELTNKGG